MVVLFSVKALHGKARSEMGKLLRSATKAPGRSPIVCQASVSHHHWHLLDPCCVWSHPQMRAQAEGMIVIICTGAHSEAGVSFAGLYQLRLPTLHLAFHWSWTLRYNGKVLIVWYTKE